MHRTIFSRNRVFAQPLSPPATGGSHAARLSKWAGPILTVLLLNSGIAAATQWQSLDEIRDVAERYARTRQATPARKFSAGALDDRLRLKNCAGRLEAFLPPGTGAGANLTVGVRCTGGAAWKLYVPVSSRLTGRVLVSRHSLERGQNLTPEDVSFAEHDLDRLPYGYLTDPAAIDGRVLRRPVPPGSVIIPPMLGQARTIRRGQTVTLFSGLAGVRIRMSGKALADGALHQRIRVENLSSGRIVEGIVRSAETVEVLID